MDFEHGHEVIVQAIEKQQEERVWEMYLVYLPNMTEKTFQTFEQYKANLMRPAKAIKKEKSTKDLISMAEKIKQADLQTNPRVRSTIKEVSPKGQG